MRINLNWNQSQVQSAQPAKKGFWAEFKAGYQLATGPQGIDLDLGCLVEMQNGDKGVVQALGNCFGTLSEPPYIQLDQDDRTGQSTDGENLFLNLDNFSDIKRILVFAFIYEGAASWSQAQGVVKLFAPDGSQIEVRLDGEAAGKSMCGIAMITNNGGQVSISREVFYTNGHEELDRRYGWGMRWVAGSK
jgi:tellurite resistance protein TerA